MKNMIVEIGNIRNLESVIEKITENLPFLPNGWADSVGKDFWEQLFPVSNYRDGNPYYVMVYDIEKNKELYELLFDLYKRDWKPWEKGFLHVYDHSGVWSVSPLQREIVKVKVHRYAPNEISRYDLLASIDVFAHKKLTFEEFYKGLYNPLVRI